MTDTRPLAGAGTLLGARYRLGEVLGVGGMATVSRARDERLGRDVAVKLFRPDVADAQDLRRISSEIRMLAALNHPSLVTLHDASTGSEGEAAYLVLELVDGPNLAELLADRAVSAAELTRLLAQVADALAYIAFRGIVHRDVKPENILITREADGRLRAKLADLGIARIADESRLTTAGAVIGTARYLSPEQVAGTLVGPPADVYALGLVLLEGLTGAVAFPGSATESAVARTVRSPRLPDRLSLPDAQLLAHMTAVEPGERPSPRDVRDRLLDWSSPGPFPLPGVDAQDLTPTRVLAPATRVLPAPDATRVLPAADATRVLPAADPPRPDADATQVLPAPGAPRAPERDDSPTVSFARPEQPVATIPEHPPAPHRRAAWSILAVLLLAGASAGVVAAWPAITGWVHPGPASSPPAYPAVEGRLGTDLTLLERQVEGDGLAPEVTLRLRKDAVAVATAAAVTDYGSAVTSLTTMATHVDAAAVGDTVSSARYQLILPAIEAVRGDLADAVAAEQAEMQKVKQDQQRFKQQQQSSKGLFDGLNDRLDQLQKDLQRQIERWTGETSG